MNIEDRILAGASDDEINAMLNAVKAVAKKKKEEEARAKAAQEANARKEALTKEARANAINALLAYMEVFGLLPEGETCDEEDVAQLEQMLIRIEGMIPAYLRLMEAMTINPIDTHVVWDEDDMEKFFK